MAKSLKVRSHCARYERC